MPAITCLAISSLESLGTSGKPNSAIVLSKAVVSASVHSNVSTGLISTSGTLTGLKSSGCVANVTAEGTIVTLAGFGVPATQSLAVVLANPVFHSGLLFFAAYLAF